MSRPLRSVGRSNRPLRFRSFRRFGQKVHSEWLQEEIELAKEELALEGILNVNPCSIDNRYRSTGLENIYTDEKLNELEGGRLSSSEVGDLEHQDTSARVLQKFFYKQMMRAKWRGQRKNRKKKKKVNSFEKAKIKVETKEENKLSYRERGLECPICYDVFSDPITTPCGHTFCKKCLEDVQFFKRTDSSSKNELTCPMCRKKIKLLETPLRRNKTLCLEISKLSVEKRVSIKQKKCIPKIDGLDELTFYFRIGNTHKERGPNRHVWTAYVKFFDPDSNEANENHSLPLLGDLPSNSGQTKSKKKSNLPSFPASWFVNRVEFHLHPTFRMNNPHIEKYGSKDCYRCTRTGWGVFEVDIHIYFCDNVLRKYTHYLSFENEDTYETHALRIPLDDEHKSNLIKKVFKRKFSKWKKLYKLHTGKDYESSKK